jgi:uncharacterized RDD family membrane protein YckC
MPRNSRVSLIARSVATAAIASSFVWAFWIHDGQIGSSVEVKEGITNVSAGTCPQAIAFSVVGLVAYGIILGTPVMQQEFRIASMWKRLGAFLVDFWFAVFTLGASFGFVDVLVEARRTGVFHWQFQRDYLVSTDGFSAAAVLVGLVAFAAYFLVPLMRRSQTIGCWIFGLVTVNSSGHVAVLPFRTALSRVYAEFRGLCAPLKTFRTRDEDGQTFYDRDSGFTVVSF